MYFLPLLCGGIAAALLTCSVVEAQGNVNQVTWLGITPPYQTVESGAKAELTCTLTSLYPLPTLMYWVAAEDNRPLFNDTNEVTVTEWRNDTALQGKLTLNHVNRTRHVNCVAILWQNGSISYSTSNTPSTVAVAGTVGQPLRRQPRVSPRLQVTKMSSSPSELTCTFYNPDDPKLSWWMVNREEPLVNSSGLQISEPERTGPQASGLYVSILRVVEPIAPLALFYCSSESEGLRAYSNVSVVYTADFPTAREEPFLSPVAIALIVIIVVLVIIAIVIALFVRRRRVSSSRQF